MMRLGIDELIQLMRLQANKWPPRSAECLAIHAAASRLSLAVPEGK